jgi:hypothetical protein
MGRTPSGALRFARALGGGGGGRGAPVQVLTDAVCLQGASASVFNDVELVVPSTVEAVDK